MLEYERTDISEWIYVNKTTLSIECDTCHCCYFKDIGFLIWTLPLMDVMI